jgi:hypothetical protein
MDSQNIIDTPSCIEDVEQQRLKWFGHHVKVQYDLLAARTYSCRY